MFGLSLGHLIVVAVVVLLFGARRLPELGSALGKGLRGFKNGLSGVDEKDTLELDVSAKNEDGKKKDSDKA